MNTDLALIAIAAGASTSAILTVFWHFHVRSYRRTLDRVRARRDAYKVEVRELREERLAGRRLSFGEHAATVVVDEPIPFTPAPDPYAPAWTSGWLLDDGTHVHTEFGQVVRSGFGRGQS